MESIWNSTVEIPPRNALEEDISVEAVVIGAGMAGILTAYLLKENGVGTVVLEADRIGSGQTGNTTAKITSQHGLCYEKMIGQILKEYEAIISRQEWMSDATKQKAIRKLETMQVKIGYPDQWPAARDMMQVTPPASGTSLKRKRRRHRL